MPVNSCGQVAVLTGQDGMISMAPPGTTACLFDSSDFPVPVAPATYSVLPLGTASGYDFRVGDPITFSEEGSANLDSSLTPGTTYYVKTRISAGITISASQGGTAIAFDGDGGTGTDNTPGAGNHIKVAFAEAFAMCEVASATLSITRGEVDRTSIPCKPANAAGGIKTAQFRSYQPGYADGNGTMVLRLLPDLTSFNNRIIQGSLFNNQSGAILKIYFNAVAGSGGSVDDLASMYSEIPVTLLGFESGISQEDTPTEFTVNYRISGQPAHLLGLTF
jgi:hypothetical protein